jgi:AcrR family transcriptional regulator
MTARSRPGARHSPARRRDAAATRAAILVSARQAFAAAGYDGAGVREIAKRAGVTAMLVNRYFGSKERLFAEVVAGIMAHPIILTDERLAAEHGDAGVAEALVRLTAADDAPLDGFRIMCRSAASATAAAIARQEIEAHYHRALAAALPGPDASERAALVLAVVAGVQIMRQMIGLTALAQCPPATLVRILGPVFRQLWSGHDGTTVLSERAAGPARTRRGDKRRSTPRPRRTR